MKLDSNGYAPSLFKTSDEECYLCGGLNGGQLVRHEVLYGSNRENSKQYGLWIYVCPEPFCHKMIHNDAEKFAYLKAEAQALFEEAHPDLDFMEIFGRNYLENKRL